MADYLTARAAIAAILGTVSITAPVETSIAKVYEVTPDSNAVGKFPCVVIKGFTLRYLRGNGKREELFGVGLRVIVRPVGGAEARDVLDALKIAISRRFDSATRLNLAGNYHVVEGPNWISDEAEADGGAWWDEGEIVLKLSDAAAFSA